MRRLSCINIGLAAVYQAILNPRGPDWQFIRLLQRVLTAFCAFFRNLALKGADFETHIAHIVRMSAQISLSASAARYINKLSDEAGHEVILRVAVEGGGCSGFQYRLDLIEAPESDDQVVSFNAARAAIDDVSAPLLDGSIIDYVEDLVGAQFKILNPNATASCGCGTSFSL